MAYNDAMHTFDSLRERLGKRDTRKVGNNTYMRLDSDWKDGATYIAIRLHSTDVVRYYQDGRIILDSGGWQTVTTKDRINTWVPHISLSQAKHVWYIAARVPNARYDHDMPNNYGTTGEWVDLVTGLPTDDLYRFGPTVEYHDGMDVAPMIAAVS